MNGLPCEVEVHGQLHIPGSEALTPGKGVATDVAAKAAGVSFLSTQARWKHEHDDA
jgi:hypothetical protein